MPGKHSLLYELVLLSLPLPRLLHVFGTMEKSEQMVLNVVAGSVSGHYALPTGYISQSLPLPFLAE